MSKPIKRNKALVPLSHDHHQGLMLCQKIKKGLKQNIAPGRIKNYTDWFWKNHLIPHFKVEEEHIFPVLGQENKLVKQALEEHQRLKDLFETEIIDQEVFTLIAGELEQHIRFEERILFNEIQKKAEPGQLAEIEKRHHKNDFCDVWEDPFWK